MPAEGLEPGECRSCQAPIYWVETVNGKKMPLDRGGENRVLVEHGKARVVVVYMSHFATCPDAKQHRKTVIRPKSFGRHTKTLKD